MGEYTYVNRNGSEIKITLIDDVTAKISEYNSSSINIGEENNSAKFKKDNPQREMHIVHVDIPGGPFLFLYMDLNDLLMSYKEFLNQDHKKIVKKIEIEGPEILITYEKKSIKKE